MLELNALMEKKARAVLNMMGAPYRGLLTAMGLTAMLVRVLRLNPSKYVGHSVETPET